MRGCDCHIFLCSKRVCCWFNVPNLICLILNYGLSLMKFHSLYLRILLICFIPRLLLNQLITFSTENRINYLFFVAACLFDVQYNCTAAANLSVLLSWWHITVCFTFTVTNYHLSKCKNTKAPSCWVLAHSSCTLAQTSHLYLLKYANWFSIIITLAVTFAKAHNRAMLIWLHSADPRHSKRRKQFFTACIYTHSECSLCYLLQNNRGLWTG